MENTLHHAYPTSFVLLRLSYCKLRIASTLPGLGCRNEHNTHGAHGAHPVNKCLNSKFPCYRGVSGALSRETFRGRHFIFSSGGSAPWRTWTPRARRRGSPSPKAMRWPVSGSSRLGMGRRVEMKGVGPRKWAPGTREMGPRNV